MNTIEIMFSKAYFGNTLRELIMLLTLALGLFSATSAFATANVTAGSASASADTAAGGIAPGFTTVSTITIAESANSIFSQNNTTYTLTFKAPSGWTFDLGGPAPSVAKNSGSSDIATGPTINRVNSTNITVVFTTDAAQGAMDTLTITGIRVQPATATGLGSANVTVTSSGTVSGGFSTTNVAVLTETAAAASELTFGVQPVNSFVGRVITPAVTVQVVDQYGNLIASNASVVMAIGTNPGGGTLSGTLTNAAVSGTATFTNLSINSLGTGYTLTASASGLAGTNSTAFNILPLDPDLPQPPTNIVIIAAGSYVIPMDNTNQSLDGTPFNVRAYGLVNQFLQHDIPVRWAIRAGKAKDAADFIASASRIYPSLSTTSTVFFAGGPFIVDVPFTGLAYRIMTNFGHSVAVYKLATNTPVDVRYTIGFKPKLAVNTVNSTIHTALFDYAGITNYTVFSDFNLLSNSCFTCFFEPHNTNPTGTVSVAAYVRAGGNFLSECHSIDTYENADHFQTTSNIVLDNINNTLNYSNADLAYCQFVGIVNAAPGGSFQDWTLGGGSFINKGYVVLDDSVGGSVPPPHYAATASKLVSGSGGMVFYLGGHDFGAGGNDITMINGQRMVLNAVFSPESRPACNFDFIADVGVGKSGPIFVVATNNLTYTISVTNFGPASASNVVVSDVLPANGVFVSAGNGGTNQTGVVNWSLGTLPIGATTNLTVTIKAPASGFLTNIASVVSSTIDILLGNNTSLPLITTVEPVGTPLADVAVSKTGPLSVLATSNLVYTISVTNFGPAVAGGVAVTDSLPAGVTFVSATGGGVNNSGVVTWNLGTLTSGQFTNLTVTVTAPTGGSLANVASVGSPTLDPFPGDNVTPPVMTDVMPLADLGLGKVGPASVLAVSNLDYTISVTNFGPSDASGVVVTDTLPAGVTFVSATAGGTNASGVVIWNLGDFVVGYSTNLTLTVTAPVSGILTNVAGVGSDAADPDPSSNISMPVVTTVTTPNVLADLAIAKSGPASVSAMSNLTYTISVTNLGPSTASSVTVTDAVPAGATFVSASGDGVNNSGVVTWNLGDLPNGAVSNVTLTVTAPADSSLTNVASAGSPTSDLSPTNNASQPVVTTVATSADVGLGKTGPALVGATSNLDYTISVTNFGPSIASGVVVTDAMPAGVTFVGASGNGANNGGVVTWDLGDLPNGAVTNLTLTVSAPADGSVTNVASAGSPTSDPNPTNNGSQPVVTVVATSADVGVGKSAAASVLATSNVVYTISVTNFGPSTASSVTATDAVPAGATFVSASGNGVNNGGVVTWDLGDLANGAVTNVTLTVIAPANGSLTNVARTGSPTSDPNPANNGSPPVVTTVGASADIGLGKSAPASVPATSNLVYTISVTNFGPSVASSVTVTDAVPAGATFVSASGNGANNGGVVTWNLGDLVNGAVTNVTLTVTAPADGSLMNVASAGSSTLDPFPNSNVTPPVTTDVLPLADLSLGKVGPASVLAVSNLVYTISVTNFGPSIAGSVTVTDAVPAGATFVSASGSGVNNGGVVTWNVGDLANGAVTNVTLTVTAPADGSLTNVASVGSPASDPNPTNNGSAPVVTVVATSADIGLQKSAAAVVGATSNLVYAISVANFGPSIASSVVVTDAVPAGATFVSASGNGANNGGVVTWNLGDLPNGAVTNLTLTVTAPADGSLTNVASAGSPTSDPDPANNTNAPVVTTVATAADVGLGKSAAASVSATSNLDYTISVTNFGPSIASSVVVTDAVPAGATFVSASGNGANNGGVVTWNLGDLPNGAVSNLTLTVSAPADGLLTNVASEGSPTSDPNPTNNESAPVVTTVGTSADIGLGKSAAAVVSATSNFDYTISVTNFGPSMASSVTVTDTVLAGATFVSASGNGANNGGVVTWNLGDLPNGAVTNLMLTVSAPADGSLTNVASTASPTSDPNPTNNESAPVVTTVATSADVGLGKSAATLVGATSNLVYTISVTNFGPSVASGVVVTDAVPAGATFMGASGNGANNGGVVTWNLGDLPNGAVTNLTLTVTAPANGSLTNRASAGSPTSDPNPTNNTSVPVVTTVFTSADVGLGKSAAGSVSATSNLVYTISVTNFGPSIASSVVVTDAVPVGATFVSASGNWANNGGVVTWNLGNLASGAVSNVTLTVKAPANGSVTNRASTASPTSDPNSANNTSAPVITTVTGLADLAAGKTGPAAALALSNFSYTISVTNLGPSTASGVVVTDTLPAGVTFVSASGGGANNGGVVTWSLGTLASGAVSNVTLTVRVPFSGTITNTANAGSATLDSSLSNNSGRAVTAVAPVIPTANGQAVATLQNTAKAITLTGSDPNSLPLTFAIASNPTHGGLSLLNTNTGAVTYTPNANYSGPDSFTFTVNNGLTNSAPATVNITVTPTADVIVLLSGPAGSVLGSNITYTITVSNAGPSTSSNIVVKDTFPPALAFFSASAGGTNASGTVTWPTIGALLNGGSTNFTLTFTATNSGVLTNIAFASAATFDPNTNNNTSQVVTVIALTPFGVSATTPVFNPQTGLYEESVWVTNNSGAVASAVRLYVTGLRSGVSLYNAYGTNAGQPYALYNYPLANGGSQLFLLEFLSADRRTFTNGIRVEITTNIVLVPPAGITANMLAPTLPPFRETYIPHEVIGFASIAGRTYMIVYGDTILSMTNVAIPNIVATGNQTLWIDSGPPKTATPPPPLGTRFYEVILLP